MPRLAAFWAGLRADARQLRRLFGYTRPYRGSLAIAWLLTAGYGAAGALLAYTVKPIFDEVHVPRLLAAGNRGRTALNISALSRQPTCQTWPTSPTKEKVARSRSPRELTADVVVLVPR